MPAAPIPSEESTRIEDLLRYDILDTEPEDSFDQLTQLAAYICQAPVSLISLVDSHRQWFKSKVGLDICETQRESAFCGYTLLEAHPLIIRDATADERVKDNELVLGEPYIRFYAGCPLISSRGFRLGSLCVIDFVPRDIDGRQLKHLQALAHQVVLLLDSRYVKKQVLKYTQAIETARQQAEQVSRANSLLLSTISHEIKTPLNGIVGMLNLLSKSDLAEQQLEFVKTLKTSASALSSAVNDTLDLARIEAGKAQLNLQPSSLSAVLKNVESLLCRSASEQGLKFEWVCDENIPQLLEIDTDRLRQVLLNLCTNAIKFTPCGGAVVVNAQLNQQTEAIAQVEISVTDTGIGIAQDQHTRILHPFVQASPDIAEEYGGTGLGLAITNRLLKLMDSQLMVNSTPNKGSCFSFCLSCEIASSGAQAPEDAVAAASAQIPFAARSLQILVAEDQPINQKVIAYMLRHRGHTVTLVSNGLDAVQQYRQGRFDLVILDLQMPLMNGKTAAQKIRQIAVLSEQPVSIVILTAGSVTESQEIMVAGIDGFIQKPIDTNALDQILAAAGDNVYDCDPLLSGEIAG